MTLYGWNSVYHHMPNDLNKLTPILVPLPSLKESAEALKWLSIAKYHNQVCLVATTLAQLHAESKQLPIQKNDYVWMEGLKNIVEMWRGYEWHLALYGMLLTNQSHYQEFHKNRSCTKRRLKSEQNEYEKISTGSYEPGVFQEFYLKTKRTQKPYWLGEKTLHESHQSWLIRYDSNYKHTFGKKVTKAAHLLPLCWPPYNSGKIKYL